LGQHVEVVRHDAVSMDQKTSGSGGLEQDAQDSLCCIRIAQVGMPVITTYGYEIGAFAEIVLFRKARGFAIGRHRLPRVK